MYSMSADPDSQLPRVGWLFICVTVVWVISVIFYIFFFGPFMGYVISALTRLVLWKQYGVYLDIGDVNISILSGELMFSRVHIVSRSQTTHILNMRFKLSLRERNPAWSPNLPKMRGPRLKIDLLGVEMIAYNRAPVFDKFVQSMIHGKKKFTGQISDSRWTKALPIEITVQRGSFVLGNPSTATIAVAGCKRMDGIFYAEEITDEQNSVVTLSSDGNSIPQIASPVTRVLFDSSFESVVIKYIPNHDYEGPPHVLGKASLNVIGRSVVDDESTKTSSPSWDDLSRDAFARKMDDAFYEKSPHFWRTLLSILLHRRLPFPPPSAWIYNEISRVLDDDDDDSTKESNSKKSSSSSSSSDPSPPDAPHFPESTTQGPSEYAFIPTMLKTHKMDLTYYLDIFTGYKTDLVAQPVDSLAQGLDLNLYGGQLNYGPWHHRVTLDLLSVISPPSTVNFPPAEPSAQSAKPLPSAILSRGILQTIMGHAALSHPLADAANLFPAPSDVFTWPQSFSLVGTVVTYLADKMEGYSNVSETLRAWLRNPFHPRKKDPSQIPLAERLRGVILTHARTMDGKIIAPPVTHNCVVTVYCNERIDLRLPFREQSKDWHSPKSSQSAPRPYGWIDYSFAGGSHFSITIGLIPRSDVASSTPQQTGEFALKRSNANRESEDDATKDGYASPTQEHGATSDVANSVAADSGTLVRAPSMFTPPSPTTHDSTSMLSRVRSAESFSLDRTRSAVRDRRPSVVTRQEDLFSETDSDLPDFSKRNKLDLHGTTLMSRTTQALPSQADALPFKIEADLIDFSATSHIAYGTFLSAPKLSLSYDSNRYDWTRWDGRQVVSMHANAENAEMFLVREHQTLLSDIISDLSEETRFETWVPRDSRLDVAISPVTIHCILNEYNAFQRLAAFDENVYLNVDADALALSMSSLGNAVYKSPFDQSWYTLILRNHSWSLSFPVWHTKSGAKDPPFESPTRRERRRSSVSSLGSVFGKDQSPSNKLTVMCGEQVEFVVHDVSKAASASQWDTSRMELDIITEDLDIFAYGIFFKLFFSFKYNYFGIYSMSKSFNELLRRAHDNVPVVNPNDEMYAAGIYSELDLNISFIAKGGRIHLPVDSFGTHFMTLGVAEFSAGIRVNDLELEGAVNIEDISLVDNGPYNSIPIGISYTDWANRNLRSIVTISRLDVSLLWLCGLPPSCESYVCLWDFFIGDILGTMSFGDVDTLSSVARTVSLGSSDLENQFKVPNIEFMPKSAEAVMRRLVINKAKFVVQPSLAENDPVSSHAVILDLPLGAKLIPANTASFIGNLKSFHVPQIQILLLSRLSNDNTWYQVGSLSSGISVTHCDRTEHPEQAHFIKSQDSLTHRCAFAYDSAAPDEAFPLRQGAYSIRALSLRDDFLSPHSQASSYAKNTKPLSASPSFKIYPDAQQVPKRPQSSLLAHLAQFKETLDGDFLQTQAEPEYASVQSGAFVDPALPNDVPDGLVMRTNRVSVRVTPFVVAALETLIDAAQNNAPRDAQLLDTIYTEQLEKLGDQIAASNVPEKPSREPLTFAVVIDEICIEALQSVRLRGQHALAKCQVNVNDFDLDIFANENATTFDFSVLSTKVTSSVANEERKDGLDIESGSLRIHGTKQGSAVYALNVEHEDTIGLFTMRGTDQAINIACAWAAEAQSRKRPPTRTLRPTHKEALLELCRRISEHDLKQRPAFLERQFSNASTVPLNEDVRQTPMWRIVHALRQGYRVEQATQVNAFNYSAFTDCAKTHSVDPEDRAKVLNQVQTWLRRALQESTETESLASFEDLFASQPHTSVLANIDEYAADISVSTGFMSLVVEEQELFLSHGINASFELRPQTAILPEPTSFARLIGWVTFEGFVITPRSNVVRLLSGALGELKRAENSVAPKTIASDSNGDRPSMPRVNIKWTLSLLAKHTTISVQDGVNAGLVNAQDSLLAFCGNIFQSRGSQGPKAALESLIVGSADKLTFQIRDRHIVHPLCQFSIERAHISYHSQIPNVLAKTLSPAAQMFISVASIQAQLPENTTAVVRLLQSCVDALIREFDARGEDIPGPSQANTASQAHPPLRIKIPPKRDFSAEIVSSHDSGFNVAGLKSVSMRIGLVKVEMPVRHTLAVSLVLKEIFGTVALDESIACDVAVPKNSIELRSHDKERPSQFFVLPLFYASAAVGKHADGYRKADLAVFVSECNLVFSLEVVEFFVIVLYRLVRALTEVSLVLDSATSHLSRMVEHMDRSPVPFRSADSKASKMHMALVLSVSRFSLGLEVPLSTLWLEAEALHVSISNNAAIDLSTWSARMDRLLISLTSSPETKGKRLAYFRLDMMARGKHNSQSSNDSENEHKLDIASSQTYAITRPLALGILADSIEYIEYRSGKLKPKLEPQQIFSAPVRNRTVTESRPCSRASSSMSRQRSQTEGAPMSANPIASPLSQRFHEGYLSPTVQDTVKSAEGETTPNSAKPPARGSFLRRLVLTFNVDRLMLGLLFGDRDIEMNPDDIDRSGENIPAAVVALKSLEFAVDTSSKLSINMTHWNVRFLPNFGSVDVFDPGSRHMSAFQNYVQLEQLACTFQHDGNKRCKLILNSSGFEVSLAASIVDYVAALHHVFTEGLARFKNIQFKKGPSAPRSETSTPSNDFSSLLKYSILTSVVLEKCTFRLHVRPTSLTRSKTLAEAVEIFELPRTTLWMNYANHELSASCSIERSFNVVYPTVLVFANHIKFKIAQLSQTMHKSAKGTKRRRASKLVPKKPSHSSLQREADSQPPSAASVTSPSSIVQLVNVNISVSVEDSDVEIHCAPLADVIARFSFKTSHLAFSMGPAKKLAQVSFTLNGLSMNARHYFSPESCVDLNVPRIVLSAHYAPTSIVSCDSKGSPPRQPTITVELHVSAIHTEVHLRHLHEVLILQKIWLTDGFARQVHTRDDLIDGATSDVAEDLASMSEPLNLNVTTTTTGKKGSRVYNAKMLTDEATKLADLATATASAIVKDSRRPREMEIMPSPTAERRSSAPAVVEVDEEQNEGTSFITHVRFAFLCQIHLVRVECDTGQSLAGQVTLNVNRINLLTRHVPGESDSFELYMREMVLSADGGNTSGIVRIDNGFGFEAWLSSAFFEPENLTRRKRKEPYFSAAESTHEERDEPFVPEGSAEPLDKLLTITFGLGLLTSVIYGPISTIMSLEVLPITGAVTDDWGMASETGEIFVQFDCLCGGVNLICSPVSFPTLLALGYRFANLFADKENVASNTINLSGCLDATVTKPGDVLDSFGKMHFDADSMPPGEDSKRPTKGRFHAVKTVTLTLGPIRIDVFPGFFVSGDVFTLIVEKYVKAQLETGHLQGGLVHRELRSSLGSVAMYKSYIMVDENESPRFTVAQWQDLIKQHSVAQVIRTPEPRLSMVSDELEGSSTILHDFSMFFAGSLEFALNFAVLMQVNDLVQSFKEYLAQTLAKGEAPDPHAIRIKKPEESRKEDSSKRAFWKSKRVSDAGDDNTAPIVQVSAPGSFEAPRKSLIFEARRPMRFEKLQFNLLGNATPPLEWFGLQRSHLPAAVHIMMTLPVESFCDVLSSVYEKQLIKAIVRKTFANVNEGSERYDKTPSSSY